MVFMVNPLHWKSPGVNVSFTYSGTPILFWITNPLSYSAVDIFFTNQMINFGIQEFIQAHSFQYLFINLHVTMIIDVY